MEGRDLDLLYRVNAGLQKIMAAGMNGNAQRAAEVAETLNREVWERISEERMSEERTAVGALSLSDLPAPAGRGLHDDLEGLGE